MQTRSCLIVLFSITLFAACGKEAKVAQSADAASAPTTDPSAAVVCSSMQDYELGLKNSLRTAPPCDVVKTELKQCVGEYSKESWTNCLGERKMPDGSHYIGGYLEGKANGKGEFINKDGTRYVGDYVNGLRSGEGNEYSAVGEILKSGKWINGSNINNINNKDIENIDYKSGMCLGAISMAQKLGHNPNEFSFNAMLAAKFLVEKYKAIEANWAGKAEECVQSNKVLNNLFICLEEKISDRSAFYFYKGVVLVRNGLAHADSQEQVRKDTEFICGSLIK